MYIFPPAVFLLSVVSVGGVIELISNILDETVAGPGTRLWNNRVQRLRDATQKLATGLVPWDGEMLQLLSLNRSQVQKPGWFGRPGGGVFTTIYHEPIVAYVQENTGKGRLLMARTSNRELVFRLKEKETELWVNRQPLGVLTKGALLAAGRGSRLLAHFDANTADAAQALLNVGDKPAAMLTNPAQADSPMPRALTLLRPLTEEEETVVLALAVLRMTGGV